MTLMPMSTTPSRLSRGPSLATWLTIAFASLLGLLTLLLVAVIGLSAGDQVRSDIGESLAELARQTADKLDRGMFERYREVRLMASRHDFADRAESRRYLSDVQASYPYYAWIGVTDSAGVVSASTNGLLEGANVSARPWYANAVKGVTVGDVHDAVLLAKLLPNPHPEPLRFVDIAFPYRASTGATGVLGAHLSWQWAREVARSIIKPRPGLERVQAFIVGRDHRVLLGPAGTEGKVLDLPSLDAAGSGSRVERWADGRSYLVGYADSEGHADYPGLGWKILVRQDLDQAFRPVEAVQRRVLITGLLIGLGFSLFGVLVARLISRPLQALSVAAEQVARGEAAAMPGYAGGLREVRTLSQSLRTLVATLLQKEAVVTELNQTLEQRVVQRTAELNAALEQVRSSQARIEAILETSHDAFIGVDLQGRITDWNSSAELLFGMPRAQVLGHSAAELIVPAHLRQRFIERLAQVDPSGSDAVAGRMELIFMDSRGREFPVETSVSLTREHGRAFFSAFLHDISARKEVERMKNEFISTVSHELRTPLTAIRFSLGMLADGSMGEFDPGVTKLVTIASDSCERLVRLINEMLDLEKIESGQMEYRLEVEPLLPLAQRVLDATRAFAAPYQVTLRLETDGSDPRVALDPDRMTQVLVNLLSNAIKFSHAGGAVELWVQTVGAQARIAVIDHGEGIPPAFRPRIFEKFAQADGSNTRTRNGTGLGLAICRELVEAHGGTIGFTSEVGQGTTFEVLLPLA
ncbi:MAG: ATP-binding protein [Gammaproteobacteria bacterium]